MSDNLKALRKRAMYDPQSLTKEEWLAIHKAVTTVPKKEFFDDDPPPIIQKSREQQKKKGSWW